MPRLSVFGLVNKVIPVGPGTKNPGPIYHVADDDTVASLQSTPTGAAFRVVLPGPSSSPGDLPSSGDYYAVADPLGKITFGHVLTVDGGGYPIAGSPTLSLTAPNQSAEFTFDDAAQAWFACVCGQGGGG